MYIQDVMTRDVKTCRPDTDAETAALLMWNEDCGAIPVVDDNDKAIGMITDGISAWPLRCSTSRPLNCM